MKFRAPVSEPLYPIDAGAIPAGAFRVTRIFGDLSFPQYGAHDGLDVGNARTHDPVVAIEAGRVTYAAFDPNSGGAGIVRVDHGDGWSSGYAHLDRIDVKVGQTVAKGQPVGILGSTGWVTAAHLHFDITRNGVRVDPWPLLQEDDVDLPTGLVPLAQGVVGPGNRLRVDPSTTDGSKVIGTDIGENKSYFVYVFGRKAGEPYTLGGIAGTEYLWVGVFEQTWYVARPLVTKVESSSLGRELLPTSTATSFTQAQLDAAKAASFLDAKTKAKVAVDGIRP